MKLVGIVAILVLPLKILGFVIGFVVRPIAGGYVNGFSCIDKRYYDCLKTKVDKVVNEGDV